MFEKSSQLGDKNIKIICTHNPYFNNENVIIFGFPFNVKNRAISKDELDNVKGYFLQFIIKDSTIEIISDIASLYRFYYMEIGNTIYFSNDFMTLFNILPKNKRTLNSFELEYWYRNRYTTGGDTICKEIKKVKPAHIYTFTDNNIYEQLYYKDFKNVPNRKQHIADVLEDLRDTVSIIKEMPQKKILLFSGGADSTLLVKMLQEQNVDFIPVFGKLIPTNSMNYDDILKIKYSSKILGIEPLEIEVDINENISSDIIDIMFLDRNITQIFFKMAEKIKEQFGDDVILLNGQASDSIFNFGPTSKNIGNFFIRHILFKPFNVMSFLFLEVIKLARKKYNVCRNVRTEDEYTTTFFDVVSYMPIFDKSVSLGYYNKIKELIISIKNIIKNKYALLMYLKIYGFMQGSDDYVNVQCCEYNNLKSLFLFATPKIIYSTVQNTDYNYEILHPKSVVYGILSKTYNYTMPNIKKEKNYVKISKSNEKYVDYEEKIYKYFYEKMSSLEFSKKIL